MRESGRTWRLRISSRSLEQLAKLVQRLPIPSFVQRVVFVTVAVLDLGGIVVAFTWIWSIFSTCSYDMATGKLHWPRWMFIAQLCLLLVSAAFLGRAIWIIKRGWADGWLFVDAVAASVGTLLSIGVNVFLMFFV